MFTKTNHFRGFSMAMAGGLATFVLSALGLLFLPLPSACGAEERTEHFDKDPFWDGSNNRATSPARRTVKQDFGYSQTAHAGRAAGEVGGFLSSAAEPAYYAKRIPTKTFDEPLTASGTLACDGRPIHALIAFFNADTLNEWRTPNSIALRISGRGDVFYAWVEYATARWRAGGDSPRSFPTIRDPKSGRKELKGFSAKGAVHRWSLTYDPKGNGGNGVVTATIGDEKAVCHLDKGHKADGATFNRFGLLNVMKHADDGGQLWLSGLTINGAKEDLSKDPGWDSLQNRRTYVTAEVRPRFDFGYSLTQHAGGKRKGELGGLVFRGDCRYAEKLAFYGDRLSELSLEKPLRAAGKISLKRGVTDSDTLIGFFHSRDSVEVNPSQDSGIPKSFLGASLGGPSRESFLFQPVYRGHRGGHESASGDDLPHVYPDGSSHDWSLEYSPPTAGVRGRITVTLDKRPVSIDLSEAHKSSGTRFDRFGIVTTWIDGNGQRVYLDDVTYTSSHEEGQLLVGHRSSVMAVAFSPDGKLLASGCRDKTIRLWDVASGKPLHTLSEHTADVYAVAFSPDGAMLASGSGDKTIRLWEVRTQKLLRTLRGHEDVVRSIAFSPDGRMLASCGGDKTVRLWAVETGKLKATLTGHEARVKSVTFSPDGKSLASAADDRTLRLWSLSKGAAAAQHAILRGHTGPLEAVAFSPDGKTLASSSNDATIRLWDAQTAKATNVLKGHDGEVDSVVFSPDGKTLASGCKDRTVRLWDAASGRLLRTLTGHKDRVESLAFAPDAKLLASGSGGKDASVRLWQMSQPRAAERATSP